MTEEKKNGLVGHRFEIRPGVEITLWLPKDLTVEEAIRLGDAIKTFPVGSDL